MWGSPKKTWVRKGVALELAASYGDIEDKNALAECFKDDDDEEVGNLDEKDYRDISSLARLVYSKRARAGEKENGVFLDDEDFEEEEVIHDDDGLDGEKVIHEDEESYEEE